LDEDAAFARAYEAAGASGPLIAAGPMVSTPPSTSAVSGTGPCFPPLDCKHTAPSTMLDSSKSSSSSSCQKRTPPVAMKLQGSDAFDASQYSFFGDMAPLSGVLGGPLEVSLALSLLPSCAAAAISCLHVYTCPHEPFAACKAWFRHWLGNSRYTPEPAPYGGWCPALQ
jgi:hypothetical protein